MVRDRLTKPLIRSHGRLEEAGWGEALDLAAAGLAAIRRRYGADANAVLTGAGLTNEKAYLIGKFARVALRTRHADDETGPELAAARAAHIHAFGVDRPMTPVGDLVRADVILLGGIGNTRTGTGAELSGSYPVRLPNAIAKARRRRAEIIAVAPQPDGWVRNGDLRLTVRPGSEGALFVGLLAEVERQQLVDWDFATARTEGIEEALGEARPWTPEAVEAATGIDPDLVRLTARLIGSANRCVILHAGLPQPQTMGIDAVSALINLALACGHAGTRGSGISLVSPLPNGQGLRDWGQGGDRLPGGRSLDDPFHRSVLSRRWGFDAGQIPTPGADYEGIVALAAAGRIRGLLTMGTAPGPDGDGPGTDTLAAIEHFVAIEPYLSEVSARHARVILPGTTVLEEEGTTTTIEGRIVRSDQEVPPAANYSEFDIIRNLSRRLGVRQHFDFVRGREVFEEMRRVSVGAPGDHFGITWDRAGDGVFWPCPTEEHPGTPRLFLDRFAHPDGRARFRLVSSRNRQTSGAGPDPCEAGVSPRTWPGSGATPRTTG